MELKLLIENEYIPQIKKEIQTATKLLYATIYVAKIHKNRKRDEVKLLLDDIINLKKKNLDVRILFNSIQNNSLVSRANRESFTYLRTNGVQIRYTPDKRTTHCKLFIIDDNISILGSHNLSNISLHSNREVSIFIKDEMTNFLLKEYFLKNFIGAKE